VVINGVATVIEWKEWTHKILIQFSILQLEKEGNRQLIPSLIAPSVFGSQHLLELGKTPIFVLF
jgi:hypothetical protein